MLCFDRVKCGWQFMFNSPQRMGQTKGQERERYGRTIQDLIIKREEENSRGRKKQRRMGCIQL